MLQITMFFRLLSYFRFIMSVLMPFFPASIERKPSDGDPSDSDETKNN